MLLVAIEAEQILRGPANDVIGEVKDFTIFPTGRSEGTLFRRVLATGNQLGWTRRKDQAIRPRRSNRQNRGRTRISAVPRGGGLGPDFLCAHSGDTRQPARPTIHFGVRHVVALSVFTPYARIPLNLCS